MLGGFWSIKPFSIDIGLLLIRITLAVLMIPHGYSKLVSFAERADRFPDPFGVGSPVSLGMVVFAEFFCSILLFLGLFTRFALLPLITAMAVAALIIHAGDPLDDKEHALLYLLSFISLFITGPGAWSLDGLLKK